MIFNLSIRKRASLLALGAVLLTVLSLPAMAAKHRFAVDHEHAIVYAQWNHFEFSNPGASFHVSEGQLVWDDENPEQSSVEVTIPVDSVSTQIASLDDKFKTDFFAADKYPNITFKSTSVEQVKKGQHGKHDKHKGHKNHKAKHGKHHKNVTFLRVKGDLTIRGVTQPVTLWAKLNKFGKHPMHDAQAIGFDAKTTIKRSDFGIDAFIPAVSDKVTIYITVEAVDPAVFENN